MFMRTLMAAAMVLSVGCAGRGLTSHGDASVSATEVLQLRCSACHGPTYSPAKAAFDIASADDSRDEVRRVLSGADLHPKTALTTAEWGVLMEWTDG